LYREGEAKANSIFRKDVIDMIQERGISEKQANNIFNMASEECGSEGLVSVLDRVEELCELF